MKSKSSTSEGRFAYEGLDRVIHERARLSVLTSLITNSKGLAFNDLKQLCALTDGNLSRHLSVLETAKMVEIMRETFPEKVTAFHEEMAVHGRYGKPCPACGARVLRIVYAQNEANYCATCEHSKQSER